MILDPLGQLDLVTMVAIVLLFLATWGLARRLFLVPLVTVMAAREARVEAARVELGGATETLRARQGEADAVTAAAREDARALSARAAEERAAERRERLSKAAAEADAIVAAGRAELLGLERAQALRLEAELAACATDVLRRLVDRVDEPALRLMAHRMVSGGEGAE